jgi:hypothetical protein
VVHIHMYMSYGVTFMSDISSMILRTVYLTPEIDSLLRTRAFRADISKNELIRKYLETGIRADRTAAAQEADEEENVLRKLSVPRFSAKSPTRKPMLKKAAALKVATKRTATKKSAARKVSATKK